ncbi:XRE family transcriptional regulator [Mycolicibacterium moriokaense]|nr:XRE family transcriptional regulator [Mycolicibacterium moriokaense]
MSCLHQSADPRSVAVTGFRGTGSNPLGRAHRPSLKDVAAQRGVGDDIRQFLTSRRGRLTPQQAGLLHYGGRRRVSGLRREEVAMLAGISVEYYTRLERGNARGVSDEVVDGVARALHLDDIERTHLVDLVRTANASPAAVRRRKPTTMRVRPQLQQLLDGMTDAAAFVRNGRLDVLSTNYLGRALYSSAFDDSVRPVNLARFVFLNPEATAFYRDWTGIARDAVGSLRTEAGQHPSDPALSELIGELSIRSEPFRQLWALHDVKYYRSGLQPFHHPIIGDLDLHYDALEVAADPGLTIVAYTAAPGSAAARALTTLGSWNVSEDQGRPVTTDGL